MKKWEAIPAIMSAITALKPSYMSCCNCNDQWITKTMAFYIGKDHNEVKLVRAIIYCPDGFCTRANKP